VLVGDAAHAMTPHLGQGACQAIEDGVVLAELLADAYGVDDALAEYDRLRRSRTRKVARMSRASARMGQQLANPLAVAVRNRLIRVTPPRRSLAPMAKVSSWRP
jgi:2-polyprenyl-6-methoxyphenol hydroxylase-like FAD-dependent oxidoreductase